MYASYVQIFTGEATSGDYGTLKLKSFIRLLSFSILLLSTCSNLRVQTKSLHVTSITTSRKMLCSSGARKLVLEMKSSVNFFHAEGSEKYTFTLFVMK